MAVGTCVRIFRQVLRPHPLHVAKFAGDVGDDAGNGILGDAEVAGRLGGALDRDPGGNAGADAEHRHHRGGAIGETEAPALLAHFLRIEVGLVDALDGRREVEGGMGGRRWLDFVARAGSAWNGRRSTHSGSSRNRPRSVGGSGVASLHAKSPAARRPHPADPGA